MNKESRILSKNIQNNNTTLFSPFFCKISRKGNEKKTPKIPKIGEKGNPAALKKYNERKHADKKRQFQLKVDSYLCLISWVLQSVEWPKSGTGRQPATWTIVIATSVQTIERIG